MTLRLFYTYRPNFLFRKMVHFDQKQNVLHKFSISPPIGKSSLGRMFSLQSSLPQFPVPPLDQTLTKFLRSVQPILSEKEYKTAEELTRELKKSGGEGELLQNLLKQRANQTINWLSEWWINVAYLDFRSPVTIHSSPGITFPQQSYQSFDGQLRFAAKLISGVLDYKKFIDNQTLEVEYLGGYPLCMKQYYEIISACRVPGEKRDSLLTFPSNKPGAPKHIIVVYNNQFFSVTVYGDEGNALSHEQIYEQLCTVVKIAKENTSPPVGIFTTEDRDAWYKAYKLLIQDQRNLKSCEEIQRSICCLCIDKAVPVEKPENWGSACAVNANNGFGSHFNSANRWADKTLQFIVGANGMAGLNYEHSTAEGPPIVALIDHALTYCKRPLTNLPKVPGSTDPVHLEFFSNSEIDQLLEKAKINLDKQIRNLDLEAFTFKNFGKGFPKQKKMSPDAFVQISFQLAYYRMYGCATATYESGTLRRFQEGRTDTIRSCSTASLKFCQAMNDNTVSNDSKVKLFHDAISAHREYTSDVVNGQGIDRHLLGLKLIAAEKNIRVPDFFNDPVYTSSVHWRMSTSQVPSKCDASLNFGPVVNDGYGLCYNPMEDHINLSVSSWKSCSSTNTTELLQHIKQALMDQKSLLVNSLNSKL